MFWVLEWDREEEMLFCVVPVSWFGVSFSSRKELKSFEFVFDLKLSHESQKNSTLDKKTFDWYTVAGMSLLLCLLIWCMHMVCSVCCPHCKEWKMRQKFRMQHVQNEIIQNKSSFACSINLFDFVQRVHWLSSTWRLAFVLSFAAITIVKKRIPHSLFLSCSLLISFISILYSL